MPAVSGIPGRLLDMSSALSFARHSARTQGFTLGVPRTFTITEDGQSVLFLRSRGGTDRSNALWVFDLTSREEHLLADPADLLTEEVVSAEEQARRERARERARGVVHYATGHTGTLAAFTISGRLFCADVTSRTTWELPAAAPVLDPRPSPDGRTVAYVSGGQLRLINSDGTDDRALAEPSTDSGMWGRAEFIAAEEMGRSRGYWWSPDSSALLAAHVEESPVAYWHIADPTDPSQPPSSFRYPAAGENNAEVTLSILGTDSTKTPVTWDRVAFPYLVATHWSASGPPVIAVQSRDQRNQAILAIDPETGQTREIHRDTDAHWVEIKPGWPAFTPDGSLVRVAARDGAYRLVVGDEDWTAAPLQVRGILDIGKDDVLISASEDDPAEVHTYRVTASGIARVSTEPGVHSAVRSGKIMVTTSATLKAFGTTTKVVRDNEVVAHIRSEGQTPTLIPRVELMRAGSRRLRSALLLPQDYKSEQGPLPVLLDPYGGPQAQCVLSRQAGFLTSQWFADQGFAVLVTDGRGMTGRGPDWDRAIAGDLAGPPLDDQVDALHAIAETRPELDLGRVAIRGWSFGGYLSALAVLRRPDVFHAAIAGAPVCDWHLYDTHYTERYLGHPASAPENYEASSVLRDASKLKRPLLLIHGTADDNVFMAHSLRLSAALTAAARPHTLLPLPGVTHVPTDENTVENLLLLQNDFLREHLMTGR